MGKMNLDSFDSCLKMVIPIQLFLMFLPVVFLGPVPDNLFQVGRLEAIAKIRVFQILPEPRVSQSRFQVCDDIIGDVYLERSNGLVLILFHWPTTPPAIFLHGRNGGVLAHIHSNQYHSNGTGSHSDRLTIARHVQELQRRVPQWGSPSASDPRAKNTGQRATKGTVLTSQSLFPWCDCRRLGSTLASWRWEDINVGNPLWRRALLIIAVPAILHAHSD